MEVYDDLATGPNENGSLNLSHDTWRTFPNLSEFSGRLLYLDMSNNQLASVPESIGHLILLQTLNVSFNQIEHIDGAIGKCIRLRRFDLSRNLVQALPSSIGSCILLEEFIAHDNRIATLPLEMIGMFVLSVVDFRNNRVKPTITQLLCDGNLQLESAPKNMRGDSALLLSCLDMQQTFKEVIVPNEVLCSELQAQSERLHSDLFQARKDMERLENEVASLEKERPDQYIYWKGRFLGNMHRVLNKINQLLDIAKRLCRWLWEKRRTHPY